MLFNCVSFALFVLVLVVDYANTSDDADLSDNYCDGTGWTPYGDEKCYKLIKKWATRDEAKEMCEKELQKSDASTPQLVAIKSVEEQNYLTEFVFSEIETNVWIGAKRQPNTNKFVWEDGSEVGDFTNWVVGNPTEEDGKDCVEMKSKFTRKLELNSGSVHGTWRDLTCKQANYVLCEKMQRWSFGKLQHSFLATRKKLENTENLLDDTMNRLKNTETRLNELNEAETEIKALKKNPVPIGFIYVQQSSQPEPTSLWSNVDWDDVTSEYAGLFFRAGGGTAEQFGTVQPENAPRVIKVALEQHNQPPNQEWRETIVNVGNMSTGIGVFSGIDTSNYAFTHRFYQSGGEVRPKNTAMRIWKRVK